LKIVSDWPSSNCGGIVPTDGSIIEEITSTAKRYFFTLNGLGLFIDRRKLYQYSDMVKV
jgi:hypothetical protein